MFEITSREITRITPDMASILLQKNTYSAQRNIRDGHVRRLTKAIQENDFHTGEVVLAKNGDGKEYLLNGQHQLTAVISSGLPVEVVLVKAACPTSADLSRLFAQYDVNATRSINDIVQAELDSLNVDWFWRTGRLVATALSILAGSSGESKAEKARRVGNHLKVGDFINEYINSDTKHLWRAPVIAAMIQTYWKDKTQAATFWEGVAFGEMLGKKDPRLKLRTFLLSSSLEGSSKNTATRKELQGKAIIAWNAWRKGKSTSLAFRHSKPIPKVL